MTRQSTYLHDKILSNKDTYIENQVPNDFRRFLRCRRLPSHMVLRLGCTEAILRVPKYVHLVRIYAWLVRRNRWIPTWVLGQVRKTSDLQRHKAGGSDRDWAPLRPNIFSFTCFECATTYTTALKLDARVLEDGACGSSSSGEPYTLRFAEISAEP